MADGQISSLLPSDPVSYAGTTGGPSGSSGGAPTWARVLFPFSNLFGGSHPKGISSSSKLQYLADILGIQGTKTLGAGTEMLATPLDYWQNLLKTPTRTSLLERTAPAVSSVVGQYSTGKKALTQLPRGGGTSAVAAELPFQQAGEVTGLLSNELKQQLDVLQPMAAEQISAIGKFIDTLGLSELGLTSESLATLIRGDLTKRGQDLSAVSAIIGSLAEAAGAAAGKGK